MRVRTACVVTAATLLGTLSVASAGPDEPPVFPTAAELVQLDVVVTDAQGHPVTDLRREDFQLLEDGRPQAISHFALGTAARPAALPSRRDAAPAVAEQPAALRAASPTTPAGRTIVLVFDDLHMRAGQLSAARRDGARFVQEQVGPRDQLALVTTSGARRIFQPLTRDRQAVLRAIERVTLQDRSARTRFGHPYISEQQAEQISRFGELASAGNEAFQLAVGQFMDEYLVTYEVAVRMVRERVRDILGESARYTRASLSTLETTVRSLAPVPGRKVVVLLTEGFFLGRGTLYDTAYDMRQIADATTRAGVVIYSLDVGGLTVPMPAGDITERTPISAPLRSRVESGQDEARREGMRAVAEETGGFAVLNNNNIDSGLRRILADNDVYYLLAYEPTSSGHPNRFRRIQVRLPGRRGLAVRTRRGYFESPPARNAEPRQPASPAKAAADTRERIHDALVSIVPLRGLPVRLTADFVDLPDAGPTVVVRAGVDVDGSARRAVALVAVVTDEEGKVVQQFEDRAVAGTAVQRRIPLRAGGYQVRVVAIGEGPDEIGSASGWVEVPDLSARRLAISSLFLSPASPAPPTDATSWRRFSGGSAIDVSFFAYNAQPGSDGTTDLDVRIHLLFEGRLLHEFDPRPIASGEASTPRSVPGGVRLSLAGLPPGEYELNAVVADRRAGNSATRTVSFTVEPPAGAAPATGSGGP